MARTWGTPIKTTPDPAPPASAERRAEVDALPALIPVPVDLSGKIEDVLWDAAKYMESWPRQLHLAKYANCHEQMAALNQEYRAASSRVHAIARTRMPGSPVVLWPADHLIERRDMLAAMVGVLGEHLPRHRASDTVILLRDIRDRAMRTCAALEKLAIKSRTTSAPAAKRGR